MEALAFVTVAMELAFVATVLTLSSSDAKAQLTKRIQACRKRVDELQQSLTNFKYHAKTCYLFVKSDLKQVSLPWTLFGLAHALSGAQFHISTQPTLDVLSRSPLIFLWILLNLLPFCIGNQRHPTAVQEDTINKAWRPIAAQRVTPTQARSLMFVAYTFALVLSSHIGGTKQCIILAILGYCYNDLGGGDKSFISRGLLNGLGFVSFGSGAMEVAAGQEIVYTTKLLEWFIILVLIVATGVQTMDMYDQEGDKTVGRSTLPLSIGDSAARWSIVLTTLAWSAACLWYWNAGPSSCAAVMTGGVLVAYRSLSKRNAKSDRNTAKVWNLWLVAIYCLPLMRYVSL